MNEWINHEWSLRRLPPDEGICLMCKSFVGGQYLRWLQLSRLVFACHKAPPIFAVSPQSFEVISLPQKSNSNRLVMMIQICSFVHLLHLFFILSLLILPFQTGCTYVKLMCRQNFEVVSHMWSRKQIVHVVRSHCSSICFLDRICGTATVQISI